MSTTAAFHPVYGCLVKAENILGANRVWLGQTDSQRRFTEKFYVPGRGDVSKFPELKCISSHKAAVINKFLADNGFTLKIDELRDNEFAAASLFRVLDKWLAEGTSTTIQRTVPGSGSKYGLKIAAETFPAANLTGGVELFSCLAHRELVARIRTESGDLVYMTVHDDVPDGMDLVARAQNISRSIVSTDSQNFDFHGVVFPKVDLSQMVDISWLERMKTTDKDGDDWEVAKALQQTMFKMNHVGFEAKSAAVIVMRTCTSIMNPCKPPLMIDRPFLVWIERAGLTVPYFTARITEEDWKDPGTIK